jgi:hypothetical protein
LQNNKVSVEQYKLKVFVIRHTNAIRTIPICLYLRLKSEVANQKEENKILLGGPKYQPFRVARLFPSPPAPPRQLCRSVKK